MSLRWDVSGIDNYKEVCWEYNRDDDGMYDLRPVTHSIIFTCIPVKIGNITEKNWEEFYLRMKMWEQVRGIKSELKVTPADIFRHIGLTVNVMNESRTAFMKMLLEELEWDHNRDLAQFKREMVQFVQDQQMEGV